MQATQMREVTYVRDGKEEKHVVTVAQATALAGYLQRTFRITTTIRKV